MRVFSELRMVFRTGCGVRPLQNNFDEKSTIDGVELSSGVKVETLTKESTNVLDQKIVN